MPKMPCNHRVQANFRYDPSKAALPSRHPSMRRFTEVLWHGEDDEGFCVYKRDPHSGEVIRIDFLPPA